MYKKIPRMSDISLGDFWGIGAIHSQLDDNKGTSLVLINSHKGKKIFELCKNDIIYADESLEHAIAGNQCILTSVIPSERRERFFTDLNCLPFAVVMKKYIKTPGHFNRIIGIITYPARIVFRELVCRNLLR
jgi:hypothetical protein